MTHEFKHITTAAFKNTQNQLKSVLATVVALDGSSYRKPGVQMLIDEQGHITGAVSGGCVEKEVIFQCQQVFKTQVPKVMTYDGRYRLGCEGVLYILLEPFDVDEVKYSKIMNDIHHRRSFLFKSYYLKEATKSGVFGSELQLQDHSCIRFRKDMECPKSESSLFTFKQQFAPLTQLIIFGAEHDAVQLCQAASLLGWEVIVVSAPNDEKNINHFPGASQLLYLDPEHQIDLAIDEQTAVLIMNHNYARDLHFVLKLMHTKPFYFGLLGSYKRREKLVHDVMERQPDIGLDFIDSIFSPAGIDIGAITPQEIAVAILGEMLAVKRNKQVPSLREYIGHIHN